MKWTIKRWNANLPNRFPKLNLIPAQRLVAVRALFLPLRGSMDESPAKAPQFVDFILHQK